MLSSSVTTLVKLVFYRVEHGRWLVEEGIHHSYASCWFSFRDPPAVRFVWTAASDVCSCCRLLLRCLCFVLVFKICSDLMVKMLNRHSQYCFLFLEPNFVCTLYATLAIYKSKHSAEGCCNFFFLSSNICIFQNIFTIYKYSLQKNAYFQFLLEICIILALF